jgi:hypothetical protein
VEQVAPHRQPSRVTRSDSDSALDADAGDVGQVGHVARFQWSCWRGYACRTAGATDSGARASPRLALDRAVHRRSLVASRHAEPALPEVPGANGEAAGEHQPCRVGGTNYRCDSCGHVWSIAKDTPDGPIRHVTAPPQGPEPKE